ncbi:MAG: PAS domain S-box protein [Chloroflexia bacterium]|nr:PAS domain S-box protein [Chloroflexia bacterium]
MTHVISQNGSTPGATLDATDQSLGWFATLFRASPAAISVSTLTEGRLLEVNDSFLHLLGYTREEVIGQTSFDLDLWIDADTHASLRSSIAEHRAVRDVEAQMRTKSGEHRIVLISAEIFESDGPPCILAHLHDITARRDLETRLRSSEERFRTLV